MVVGKGLPMRGKTMPGHGKTDHKKAWELGMQEGGVKKQFKRRVRGRRLTCRVIGQKERIKEPSPAKNPYYINGKRLRS